MTTWKSTPTTKVPCVAADGIYLDEYANVKDLRSRQKSGTMTPPGSVGTMESNSVESRWQSDQARISGNQWRVSTPSWSIQQARSYPPESQAFKKNIPTFDDLDLPVDKDPWFEEGQIMSQMTMKRGPPVERGMLFPWMTDSEIV